MAVGCPKCQEDLIRVRGRVRKIARRLSDRYSKVVILPTSMHGPQYELLREWTTIENLGRTTSGWFACGIPEISVLRASYRALARAYPRAWISQHFEQVDQILREIDAAARLLNAS